MVRQSFEYQEIKLKYADAVHQRQQGIKQCDAEIVTILTEIDEIEAKMQAGGNDPNEGLWRKQGLLTGKLREVQQKRREIELGITDLDAERMRKVFNS